MVTSHKYYDNKIRLLAQKITYLERDFKNLATAFARITWDADNNMQLTLVQLRREIEAVQDTFVKHLELPAVKKSKKSKK